MALCNPYQQWFDTSGRPLTGGKLYAYLAGTTTPTNTWQDANFSILNTNPVILDSAGYSMVWLNPTVFYKFRMTDQWDAQQWTIDNVSGNLLCAPSGGGPVEPGGPPTIVNISPNSGPVAGGNQITITGTNFDITATVMFNGTPATNVGVLSTSTLMATVPPGNAGTVSVTVTVNAQPVTLMNAYTYIALPTVSSILPVSGSTAGGTVVTIIGTNFSAGATVSFGGIPATAVTVNSPTSITATAPPGTGAVAVVVTVGGQSASAPTGFTYIAGPAVTGISPVSGSANGGTAVTITGTNFVLGATVTIRGVAATNPVVVSPTSITATTPAGAAGAATVNVTNPDGQVGSLPNGYTYLAVPTVTGVSPNSGTANTTTPNVTITGTNFAAGATVTFDGTPATAVVVTPPTSITCTAPSRGAGGVIVAVTVSGQTGNSAANAFTYVTPAQPIYGGVGVQGATGVNVAGSVVSLNTGEALTQLQNTPETTGQNLGPFAPNGQCVYLLLYGGSHTFVDQTNAPFSVNAPIPVTVNGASMYLYASVQLLYFTWTIKVLT